MNRQEIIEAIHGLKHDDMYYADHAAALADAILEAPSRADSALQLGEHPSWLLAIVAALEDYESKHGHPQDGWHCLGGPLAAVPAAVRAQAGGYSQAKRATDG